MIGITGINPWLKLSGKISEYYRLLITYLSFPPEALFRYKYFLSSVVAELKPSTSKSAGMYILLPRTLRNTFK